MKILWILLIATLIEAKVLEVKQLFNIQKVSVKKISFKEQKSFYAKTKIADNSIKAVALRYDGFINRLFIDKEYQFVKKDQPLFNIYSKEALAIHQEFLVSKQISRSAKSNAIRKLQLLELKGLTKFKKSIYDFNISSPFEGYVIEKNILEGSSIKKGKTLLKIADLSKLWVIAKVYQKDIGFIKKGMKAKISIDGFKPSTATVNFIYPKVDTKDQTISVRLILDNLNLKYYPNLFAKVEFEKEANQILALPKSAVLQKNGKSYVFVPVGKDGEFEPKEIKAKRLHNNKYQIISGLSEGETVIDNALFMLDSDAITNALYDSADDDW
jgi:Cu(I)/Ag(I) efflux system membrane fusion protein